jgi:hypothetical protein
MVRPKTSATQSAFIFQAANPAIQEFSFSFISSGILTTAEN